LEFFNYSTVDQKVVCAICYFSTFLVRILSVVPMAVKFFKKI
jgi:hypothetical protein